MKSVSVGSSREGQSVKAQTRIQGSSSVIHFKTGQIFEGKVVDAPSRGRVHIAAGGKTLEAHARIPLVEGRSYLFQVRSVIPRVELEVLKEGAPDRISAGSLWISGRKERRAFTMLLKDLASSPSAKSLRRLIPMVLYQAGQGDAARLSRNLLTGGMFWENKVFRHLFPNRSPSAEPAATLTENDLKGILLSLKEEKEHATSRPGDAQTAMDRIDRLLAFLEKQQTLNLHTLREGWGWYWFIPGADQREFLYGELLGKREEDQDLHHVRMNLSFTRLGEIHVDCVLQEKRVSLSIETSEERVARFLEQYVGLLEKGIESQGLAVVKLACKAGLDGQPFNLFPGEKNASSLMDRVI